MNAQPIRHQIEFRKTLVLPSGPVFDYMCTGNFTRITKDTNHVLFRVGLGNLPDEQFA